MNPKRDYYGAYIWVYTRNLRIKPHDHTNSHPKAKREKPNGKTPNLNDL